MDAMQKLVLLAIAVTLTSGCSAAVWEGIAAGMQGAAQGAALSGSSGSKLMLFGGEDHKTYLGCINCSEFASDSVFNEYGQHGSRYASNSVINPYSPFGSKYSATGACSPYASDPPVIVDQNGGFYGRLTMNSYHAQRTRDQNLLKWLAAVCAD